MRTKTYQTYLYFIEMVGQDWTKVGISDNPEERMAMHQVSNPYPLTIHTTIACRDRPHAFALETLINADADRGEWHNCNAVTLLLKHDKILVDTQISTNAYLELLRVKISNHNQKIHNKVRSILP